MTKEKENVRNMARLTMSRNKEPKDCGREKGRREESWSLPKEACFLRKDYQTEKEERGVRTWWGLNNKV